MTETVKISFENFLKEESRKIIFQFVYWGLFALVIIACLRFGLLNLTSSIPEGAERFLEERSSLWVLGIEILLNLLIIGLCGLIKKYDFVETAREELARLFYLFGTFMTWMLVVVGYITREINMFVAAAMCWFLFVATGCLMYYYVTERTQTKQV